jgi:Tfp pilus assembly protein PilO
VLRRVLTEQRRFLTLLGVALAANIAIYAGVVYPLGRHVADARRRATEAEQTRRVAQRDFAAAKNLATGSARATEDLRTFYEKVLPADVSAAHRATYVSVAQLARKTNLRITRRGTSEAPAQGEEASLDRFTWGLVLEGNYEDVRRFIHEVETSPTFVVIDALSIGQGRESAAGVVLNLQLSTYYRARNDAS